MKKTRSKKSRDTVPLKLGLMQSSIIFLVGLLNSSSGNHHDLYGVCIKGGGWNNSLSSSSSSSFI